MQLNRIGRREVLTGGLALVALTACGGSSDAGSSAGTGSPLAVDRLGVRFPDGFRAPSIAVADSGPQRFPFVLIAEDGFPMIDGAPETIEVELAYDGEVLSTETIAARGVGQFTPYYPLVFAPEQPGRYTATPTFGKFPVEFMVMDRSEVSLFQVGDTIPPFDTPTTSDGHGVTTICTRSEPCEFHEITLTEALSNGKPTALLIATPEFCQTDVCGPSVEFFIEAAAARNDMNFIHAEVFADPRNPNPEAFPELAPLLTEWQLAFEPSLFVADANGVLVEARHFAMDRDEVAEAINAV